MISAKKLKILTESAKYDVSCSSSGSNRKNSGGIGDASYSGICHTFTQDGRCVSLLKILMTNYCCYDCLYCASRRSSDIERAIATPDEICELTMEFYKRNYIEGLFLSSAVYKSPDYTAELLLETVIKLRKLYGFNGYIHLKGIPGADNLILFRAGEYVDRISYNLELPTEKSLRLLAPDKNKKAILTPISLIREVKENSSKKSRFLPAGQTTQIIVGASPEKDGHIVRLTESLYKKYKLKRVYYSSYIPMNKSTNLLPQTSAGLLREHRLYQADWLIRFYGFKSSELLSEDANLPLKYDPKCSWALNNMQNFPVEINSAPPELLVRVPGIGFKSAYKIVSARKYATLTENDLVKMKIPLKKARHFITINGKFLGLEKIVEVEKSLALSEQNYEQISMFSDAETSLSTILGEF